MTSQQLKNAVIDKLADDLKIYLSRDILFRDLLPHVERAMGRKMFERKMPIGNFFRLYLEDRKIGKPIKREFKPWKPTPHPRQAEIDAAQPPVMNGMRAVGNGSDESKHWYR